jgi:hypothetical protein
MIADCNISGMEMRKFRSKGKTKNATQANKGLPFRW